MLGRFWDHFRRLQEAKIEKMRSGIDLKKKVAKKSRECVREDPGKSKRGGGCPIQRLEGRLDKALRDKA